MVVKVLLQQKWEIVEIVELVIACSYKSVVDHQEGLVIELHYFFFLLLLVLARYFGYWKYCYIYYVISHNKLLFRELTN